MTNMLFIVILTQIILMLGGFGLLQLCYRHTRIDPVSFLPFYWGTGTVLLYLIGGFFVLSDILLGQWHWVMAAVFLTLFALALWQRSKIENAMPRFNLFNHHLRWPFYLLAILLLTKLVVVTFIILHNPIIDSDATYIDSYVSMSKKIAAGISRSATLAITGQTADSSLGPVIIGAWSGLFLDRWHNHAVAIPWLFCYLSLLGIVFGTSYRLNNNLLAALIITLILGNAYIISNHIIRPGFHEVLVAHFLAIAFSGLALFVSRTKPSFHIGNLSPLLLMLLGALGAFLSKGEGKLWVVFLIVIFVSYLLNHYRKVSWTKIIVFQALLAAVILVLWYVFGEAVFSDMGHRGRQLVPASYDPRSMEMTLNFFFQWNTFGMIWWLAGIAAVYTLLFAPLQQRIFVFYLLSILTFLIFFTNMTGNAKFTINGTSLGRFLAHIIIIPILLYNLAIIELQRRNLLPTTTTK